MGHRNPFKDQRGLIAKVLGIGKIREHKRIAWELKKYRLAMYKMEYIGKEATVKPAVKKTRRFLSTYNDSI